MQISAAATAILEISRPAVLEVGNRFTASVQITDDNNNAQNLGAVTSYIWQTAQSGGSILQQGTDSVYVLTDVAQASALYLEVHYVDSLGYAYTLAAEKLPSVPPTRGSASIQQPANQNPIHDSRYTAALSFTSGGGGMTVYQWQQTNGGGGNGTDISGANSSIFVLDSTVGGSGGNWDTAYSHLRVRATHTDADGRAVILLSPEVEIARAANHQFNFLHASGFRVGDNITANLRISDFNNADANDILLNRLHYTWKTAADNSGRDLLTGVNMSVFAITVRSELGNLFVSVQIMDELGYATVIAQKLELDVTNPALAANITPPSQPIIDATFAADVQNNTPAIPAELTYQWRQTDSGGTGIDILSATNDTFILRSTLGGGAGWNTDYTHLQLLVIHTNPIGAKLTITTSPVPVAQSANLQFNFLHASGLAVGNNITANLRISDFNNADANDILSNRLHYTWKTAAGDAGTNLLAGVNMSVFAIANRRQLGNLFVSVQILDALGYATNIERQLSVNVDNPALVINITPPQPTINATYTANVQNNNNVPADLTYQWWQTDSSGTGIIIPSETSTTFILRSTLGSGASTGWNTDYTHLRFLAIHTNPIGQLVTFAASPVPVAQPPIINVQFSRPIFPTTTFTISADCVSNGQQQRQYNKNHFLYLAHRTKRRSCF